MCCKSGKHFEAKLWLATLDNTNKNQLCLVVVIDLYMKITGLGTSLLVVGSFLVIFFFLYICHIRIYESVSQVL